MKKTLNKMRLFPMYWKVLLSVLLAVAGWTLGTVLFFSADDLGLLFGVIVLAILFWILLNMWLPIKESEDIKREDDESEEN